MLLNTVWKCIKRLQLAKSQIILPHFDARSWLVTQTVCRYFQVQWCSVLPGPTSWWASCYVSLFWCYAGTWTVFWVLLFSLWISSVFGDTSSSSCHTMILSQRQRDDLLVSVTTYYYHTKSRGCKLGKAKCRMALCLMSWPAFIVVRRPSQSERLVYILISRERFCLESPNFAWTSRLTHSTATPDMKSPAFSSRHLSKFENDQKWCLRQLWVEFQWHSILPGPTNWWASC